jgi:Raf kinase inhibitor-like YbhB/YbcL family protein
VQMRRNNFSSLLVLLCLLMLFVAGPARAEASNLKLQSVDFAANEPIPVAYTCSGEGESPALTWSGVPAAAKAMALIVRDPDAPMGSYVHWVIYNVPASVTGLSAAVPNTATIGNGAVQGINGRGKIGYQGMCPPPGPAHHYHFRLYALDAKLKLGPGASADEVERAIKGHTLAATELVGTFTR